MGCCVAPQALWLLNTKGHFASVCSPSTNLMVCQAPNAGAGRRCHRVPHAQIAAAGGAWRGAAARQAPPAHHQHAAGAADKVDSAALLAECLHGTGNGSQGIHQFLLRGDSAALWQACTYEQAAEAQARPAKVEQLTADSCTHLVPPLCAAVAITICQPAHRAGAASLRSAEHVGSTETGKSAVMQRQLPATTCHQGFEHDCTALQGATGSPAGRIEAPGGDHAALPNCRKALAAGREAHGCDFAPVCQSAVQEHGHNNFPLSYPGCNLCCQDHNSEHLQQRGMP